MNETRKNINKIILISNQGLHPVLPKLKKQNFISEDTAVFTITTGNVEFSLDFAKTLARKVKQVVFDYSEYDPDFYVLWSGMPIYNNIIYNVLKSVTNKEPLFFVWNKELRAYEVWNIDARNLIFDKKVS